MGLLLGTAITAFSVHMPTQLQAKLSAVTRHMVYPCTVALALLQSVGVRGFFNVLSDRSTITDWSHITATWKDTLVTVATAFGAQLVVLHSTVIKRTSAALLLGAVRQVGVTTFGGFEVEVVDPVADYMATLKEVFDFDMLKKFVTRSDFSMVFDAMHAVTGWCMAHAQGTAAAAQAIGA